MEWEEILSELGTTITWLQALGRCILGIPELQGYAVKI
jgi:hypothetical protein